jgi:hypothetical protein
VAVEGLETIYTEPKKPASIQISGVLTNLGGVQTLPRVSFNWLAQFVWGDCGMHVILIDEHELLWRLVRLEHQEI